MILHSSLRVAAAGSFNRMCNIFSTKNISYSSGTTLFKVILGNIKLDKGTLYTGNKVIGYLPQEVEFTHNENVYEYLLSARPIKKLEDEIAELYTKISDSKDQKYIDKTLKVIAKKQEVLEQEII